MVARLRKMSGAKSSRSPRAARARNRGRPRPTAGLSRVKKVAFSLVATLLSFALLEGVLTILGVQPESYETDPYITFSSRAPLFLEQTGPAGQTVLGTARNQLHLFNPQQFPQAKAPGVYRIFSVGGSTTFGRPYDDATSFNGWLREFLRATVPDVSWEVINAGGVSYASYRVARLMEELIRYEPDLFIIYSGHNEFLEERIYRKITKLPRVIRALSGLAGRSRAATLVQQTLARVTRSDRNEREPETVLPDEVVTLLDDALGPSAYTRNDELREQILRHYEFNLGRMVDIARSQGAQVFFVKPASNLRDAPPFKSEHRQGLSAADRRRWQELYDQARHDLTNATPANALRALQQASAIDNRPAFLHFVRGRVLEKLARYHEAKAAYERACDEDVCPLRALTLMRETVTRVAAEREAPLIDFEALQEWLSDHGIPGAAVFHDHVHPRIESHRLLALEILKTMERQGIADPALAPALIERVTRTVLGRIDQEAHSLALMNLSKVLGWAGKHEEAYRAASRAVQLGPNIAAVRYQAGLCARLVNRLEESIEQYRQAVRIKPTAAQAHCGLGVALEDRGELAEAIVHYRLALQYGQPKDAQRDRKNLLSATQKLRAEQSPTESASED